ncbi:bifunctional (p)ppGpp synthetase/guanosine-3',5'-bis(diphosphate) 3'-pyrophosphohydrolase [Candidatus Peregrinibacteria bacterium]|nr:MAG: bifunctional (p)ppGpp synthetase/guanosine-3',5'-bis(diphosphate) 3'-pyrophosphohydrolase [Candidatus Peregrinibacteria bacterium]
MGEKLSVKEREQLIERVGNGSLQAVDVIKKVLSVNQLMKHAVQENKVRAVLNESVHLEKPDILITGEKGYKTQLASCCAPAPTVPIIGYITRGRGVTIHKKACRVLKGLEEKRLIRANWSTEKVPHYDVMLKIERQSRIGLLRDVADVFARLSLSISDMSNSTKDSFMLIGTSLDSVDTLTTLITHLEQVEGVNEVSEMS